MTSISALLPFICLGGLTVMSAYLVYFKRRAGKQQQLLEVQVQALASEVQGLSHASMGIGRRALHLDKEIEVLKSGIDEMRSNDPTTVSYSEASRLVELGAGVEDLMNTCGISRPEAELVSALTQSKVASERQYDTAQQVHAGQAVIDESLDDVPTLRVQA